MEWELIESAPKDGSAILAWRIGWDRPAFVRWILNPRTQAEFWNDADELDAYELEDEPPTHWISLSLPISIPDDVLVDTPFLEFIGDMSQFPTEEI